MIFIYCAKFIMEHYLSNLNSIVSYEGLNNNNRLINDNFAPSRVHRDRNMLLEFIVI